MRRILRTIHRGGRVCHMQALRITLLSHGSDSVHSAMRALERIGTQAIFSCGLDNVAKADGLIAPGAGAFDAVMR